MLAMLAARPSIGADALEEDRDDEERGRRTEEGDEVPLRADADVPDLA